MSGKIRSVLVAIIIFSLMLNQGVSAEGESPPEVIHGEFSYGIKNPSFERQKIHSPSKYDHNIIGASSKFYYLNETISSFTSCEEKAYTTVEIRRS